MSSSVYLTTQFMPLFYISLLSILIATKDILPFILNCNLYGGAEKLTGHRGTVCVCAGVVDEDRYQSPCLSKRSRG